MRETKTDHKILGKLRLGEDDVFFITSAVDPMVIGVAAPLGSMLWYVNQMYLKIGVDDTDWELFCERFEQLEYTGFIEWEGSGNYWSVVGSQFTVLRGGSGRILTYKVNWEGAQIVTLVANQTNYIFVEANGTIVTATTPDYQGSILLFEVLYDGTNVVVCKENHPYKFPSPVSSVLHNILGTVFHGEAGLVERVTTVIGDLATNRQVKFTGEDTLEDHGISTLVTALNPIVWQIWYKNSAGNWVRYSETNELTNIYNNAGTIATGANNRSCLFTLYVAKDSLNTTTPVYIAVPHTAVFSTLAKLQTAVSAGTFTTADNELKKIELAQLGFASVRRVDPNRYLDWVSTAKDTAGLRYSQLGASGNHLLLADISGGMYSDGGHYGLINWVTNTTSPSVTDDENLYKPLTHWYNSTLNKIFVCTDTTEGAAVWVELGTTTGGVEEAPSDGKTYGRKDAAWTEITSGGGLPDDTNSFLLNIGNLKYTVTVDTADKTECKFITPSAIPPQTTKAIGFSSDSVYMAIGSATAPYIHVYKRSGSSHVKLADVSGGNPAGDVTGVAFTANGLYMAVSHTSSPYVTIYKNNGADLYIKLTNPVTLPTGAAMGVSFNSDGTLLVVAHTVSPFMTAYSMSADVFTKLANPSSLPVDTATGCAVMGDGSYIMLSHNITPYVNIYSHSGGVLTKQSNPGSLPTVASNGVACSVDGVYWFISQASTPYVSWYKRSSSTFTKQTNPPAIAEGYNLNVSLWEKPY